MLYKVKKNVFRIVFLFLIAITLGCSATHGVLLVEDDTPDVLLIEDDTPDVLLIEDDTPDVLLIEDDHLMFY